MALPLTKQIPRIQPSLACQYDHLNNNSPSAGLVFVHELWTNQSDTSHTLLQPQAVLGSRTMGSTREKSTNNCPNCHLLQHSFVPRHLLTVINAPLSQRTISSMSSEYSSIKQHQIRHSSDESYRESLVTQIHSFYSSKYTVFAIKRVCNISVSLHHITNASRWTGFRASFRSCSMNSSQSMVLTK